MRVLIAYVYITLARVDMGVAKLHCSLVYITPLLNMTLNLWFLWLCKIQKILQAQARHVTKA